MSHKRETFFSLSFLFQRSSDFFYTTHTSHLTFHSGNVENVEETRDNIKVKSYFIISLPFIGWLHSQTLFIFINNISSHIVSRWNFIIHELSVFFVCECRKTKIERKRNKIFSFPLVVNDVEKHIFCFVLFFCTLLSSLHRAKSSKSVQCCRVYSWDSFDFRC